MGKDGIGTVGQFCPPGFVWDPISMACVPGGNGRGGGGGTTTLADLLAELIKIENRLADVEALEHLDIDAGALAVQIETFATITNTAFTSPYPGSKKAKSGYFENLSATDDITVARTAIGGVPAPSTKGYVM